MAFPATAEVMVYRRVYKLFVGNDDVLVVAPDGDIACFPSMSRARLWCRRHLRQARDS